MRNPTYPLSCVVTASLLAVGVFPAGASTVLSEAIDPLHVNQGNRHEARAIGSIETISGDGTLASASGTVIADGVNSVWVLTAAHVVADVGAIVTDTDITPAEINFSVSNTFASGNTFSALEWYVPEPYDGAVINQNDIALIRLDLDKTTYAGPSLPIFSRPTNDQALADLVGEDVKFVGFGATGTGLTGSTTFDGVRRLGRNRIDGVGDADGFILTTDFDVDWDDELYDGTPDDFTDRNPAIESHYALENSGEFIVSGGVEARQFPEKDFRIPFESAVTPGDSGGAILVGGAVAGVTSFGDVDENGNGGLFTFSQGFVSTSPWADWLVSVVGQVEAGDTPFGTADVGVLKGLPTEISILEAKEAAAMEGGGGGSESATLVFNGLVTSYYLEDALTTEDKMKLLNYIPVSDNNAKTPQEIIDIIGDPTVTDLAGAQAVIEQKLLSIYGAPTLDRAINSTQRSFKNLLHPLSVPRSGVVSPVFVFGDLDGDGVVSATDIDLLQAGINGGSEWADYNFDFTTDAADLDELLTEAFGTVRGDADLDGQIAQADLDAVLLNWGQADTGWAGGDFDGDGIVAQADLDAVLLSWGFSAEPNGNAVPEPATLAVLGLGTLAMLRRRH